MTRQRLAAALVAVTFSAGACVGIAALDGSGPHVGAAVDKAGTPPAWSSPVPVAPTVAVPTATATIAPVLLVTPTSEIDGITDLPSTGVGTTN